MPIPTFTSLSCALLLLSSACMQVIPGYEQADENARTSLQADNSFLSSARPGDILLSSHNEDGACQYLYDWINALVNPTFCHAMLVTAVDGNRVSVVEAGGPGTLVAVEQDISARVASNAHVALLRVPGISEQQRQEVVSKGLSYVGRPYAEPYQTGNGMYCSYLVYMAYLEGAQTDLSDWLMPITPDDLVQSAHTSTVHDTGFREVCYPCADSGFGPGQCSLATDGNSYQCNPEQCLVQVDACTGDDPSETPDSCWSCSDAGMAAGACEDWGANEYYACSSAGCVEQVSSCPEKGSQACQACSGWGLLAGECSEFAQGEFYQCNASSCVEKVSSCN